MKLNKTAYMRTLEIFIAFILTFSFIIYVAATKEVTSTPSELNLDILSNFEQRTDFRNCVYSNNVTCVENLVGNSVPSNFNTRYTINDMIYNKDKNIFIDSLYLTGQNSTDRYVVRLFYWKKS